MVFAAGFGLRVSALSLLTSWIRPDSRGLFYGVVAVLENLGVMASEPILQNIFAASLDFSTFWLGLPFFCSAVSIAMPPTSFIRLMSFDDASLGLLCRDCALHFCDSGAWVIFIGHFDGLVRTELVTYTLLFILGISQNECEYERCESGNK